MNVIKSDPSSPTETHVPKGRRKETVPTRDDPLPSAQTARLHPRRLLTACNDRASCCLQPGRQASNVCFQSKQLPAPPVGGLDSTICHMHVIPNPPGDCGAHLCLLIGKQTSGCFSDRRRFSSQRQAGTVGQVPSSLVLISKRWMAPHPPKGSQLECPLEACLAFMKVYTHVKYISITNAK